MQEDKTTQFFLQASNQNPLFSSCSRRKTCVMDDDAAGGRGDTPNSFFQQPNPFFSSCRSRRTCVTDDAAGHERHTQFFLLATKHILLVVGKKTFFCFFFFFFFL
jgi:hypothetical protein